MAMDSTELSQTEKQHLSELAEKTGDAGVRAAAAAYLERFHETSDSNGISKSDQEREQAFLEAAGGWADMDTDKLIADIYEQRLRQTRPAPEWQPRRVMREI